MVKGRGAERREGRGDRGHAQRDCRTGRALSILAVGDLTRHPVFIMAPPKATAWPESIYEDPDVLTLDEAGRFIICGVCADSYATRRGKKPKPVIMNACFRTRAWETHKLRTRAHRLPKIVKRGTDPKDRRRLELPSTPQPPVYPSATESAEPSRPRGPVLPRLSSISCVRSERNINTVPPRAIVNAPSNLHGTLFSPSPLVFPLSRISNRRSELFRPQAIAAHRNQVDQIEWTDERKGSGFEVRMLKRDLE